MKFAKFPYFQLAFFCASAALAAPKRDVFDTDMGNDVDDASRSQCSTASKIREKQK